MNTNVNDCTLAEASELLRHLLNDDAEINHAFEAGDQERAGQTKHGKPHGVDVHNQALSLMRDIEAGRPGTFSDWQREFTIPLTAFTHDLGSFISEPLHDVLGAKWVGKLLRNRRTASGNKLPEPVIRDVQRGIAFHRAHRYMTGGAKLKDPVVDIVYLADKAIGDESRVREDRLRWLRWLTAISIPSRFARIGLRFTWVSHFFRKGGIHDRVNFAIKSASMKVEPGQEIVLKLNIDERVCHYTLPMRLYGEPSVGGPVQGNRYVCCDTAARNLGFQFVLDLNGHRYRYSTEEKGWVCMPERKTP